MDCRAFGVDRHPDRDRGPSGFVLFFHRLFVANVDDISLHETKK
jgi:hypothetical protein